MELFGAKPGGCPGGRGARNDGLPVATDEVGK